MGAGDVILHRDSNKSIESTWVVTATKGKGKVIVPKSSEAEEHVGGGPATIAALSNIDIQHGEKMEYPSPRVDRALSYTWIQYYTLDSPQQAYAALGCMWDKVPVLIRKSQAVKDVGGLTFENLGVLAGTGDVDVLCSDVKKHRFIEADREKNDPRGPYYVREFETQVLKMPVKEFVQCSRSWRKQKLHLTVPIMRYFSAKNDEGSGDESFIQHRQEGALEGVAEHVQRHVIDWSWLHGLLSSQRFYNARQVFLEAGVKNGLLPTRYSPVDQLYIQLGGSCRVTLVAPSDALGGLYPYPTAHPYDSYAMASLEKLDRDRWPGVGNISVFRGIVSPGDVLYVPAFWSVHVHDLEDENIYLRITLSSGKRAPDAQATLLRLSRAIEERVADVVGVADVKHWLRRIASGQETKYIDLSTVKGYTRARMSQDIRDEITSSMGEGTWADALRRMIDCRLEPTPWLNENFREPLLLTDTPVRIEDTRTDEEKKYPTLFRQKLEKEGWHVPKTESTVPIPGVNMPRDADYRLL